MLNALQRDFQDWAYRGAQVKVRANEALNIYAGPEVSQAEFRTLCADAARQARDSDAEKVSSSFDKQIDRLQVQLAREGRELREDESELSQRKMEELGTHAENVLSLFSKRRSRRLSTSLSKRRMTDQAKADVEESLDAIADIKKQVAALEVDKAEALEAVSQKWGEVADQIREISITPLKKDVLVELFGVAWVPFHLVQIGAEVVELPGYGAA
jgi:hypothetical protein